MAATRSRRSPAPTPAPVRPLYPDLPIGLYAADGTLRKVINLEDPRNGYIRAMNTLEVGLYAAPVSLEGRTP